MSPHRTESMDGCIANGNHQVVNGSATPETPLQNGVNGCCHDDAPELVNGSTTHKVKSHMSNSTGPSRVRKSQFLRPSAPESAYDLVCVGFGPASLAIAVALHDALEAGSLETTPKVLFLERQPQFAWHAGMLLPGAKMQISFIKDLATLRDPRSNFTFLNYLHKNDRLVEFTNLSTFTPARSEFEDYLRWCAAHFEDVVQYNNEVVSVSPDQGTSALKTFTITSRNAKTGATTSYRSRNVILAVGGQPSIPKLFPARHPRVIHSSQYAHRVPTLLRDSSAPYRVAVIGAGQSAAEIFRNVQNLYPNSKTSLIMRSEFLKPSDDSPFVNSIFNPAFVDQIYSKPSAYRRSLLEDARATNYSVVRLELIEELYETMYHQRRTLGVDEKKWPHRIMAGTQLEAVEEIGEGLRIRVAPLAAADDVQDGPLHHETLDVDLVICATGYQRTAHVDMLKDIWPLLPEAKRTAEKPVASTNERWILEADGSDESKASARVLEVGRNYGVRFSPGAVASGSGVWLQGCCEATHGLSDTLLSVLSTRSGEMVDSIFGCADSE
ncbi:L-ornithine N(5)-monooxygenase [Echria macrotheca]|uniref:L-ornithine N(5)-monooxygenase [NAD(P)H] n=1 Tax=Echria macrotheca TaxID=438768 RepID=A0AAJ0FE38_9PEZI|nr:L-ornithine N(5)-monooxygenase [Echria macrotheca]